ncbi:MAG TPA: hypothetical protein VH186_21535 [Chloroflexia bacterium]|nr:hypothetical protein [Chloroflexia bacterium]
MRRFLYTLYFSFFLMMLRSWLTNGGDAASTASTDTDATSMRGETAGGSSEDTIEDAPTLSGSFIGGVEGGTSIGAGTGEEADVRALGGIKGNVGAVSNEAKVRDKESTFSDKDYRA